MIVAFREEYPRPAFVRKDWLTLNGVWQFAFDDEDRGVREGWFADASHLTRRIRVPYAYQTAASGINEQDYHPIAWYAREFTVPETWAGRRVLLHFGAVDYEAAVWVNGLPAGQHCGGYVPFHLDITDLLQLGTNTLVVRVFDPARTDRPRGKQSARREPFSCWYTAVTGIWQSVWLEPVRAVHLEDVFVRPDIDNNVVCIDYKLSGVEEGLTFEATVLDAGKVVATAVVPLQEQFDRWSDITPRETGTVSLAVPNARLWSPEDPYLYDLVLCLRRGDETVDEVKTYFGMRKVHVADGQFFLNNRRYYQRLVLDQGYWAEGLYTAPSAESIRRDVELIKAMGFNGVRKHQKIEDPYFYYYCDKLGLLVWSEMPAAYEFSEEGARSVMYEWQAAVRRDRNHPCIVAWVPLNESWGVDVLNERTCPRAEAHLMALYYATHALDGTRPVISNDGWHQVRTDIVTIHEYTQDADDLAARLRRFLEDSHYVAFSHDRPVLLPGYEVDGAAILLTEFGGTKVEAPEVDGWGYGQAAKDYEEMAQRLRALVDAVLSVPRIQGFCYTQLTDVQQEVNGLLTIDRRPKLPLDLLRSIFARWV